MSQGRHERAYARHKGPVERARAFDREERRIGKGRDRTRSFNILPFPRIKLHLLPHTHTAYCLLKPLSEEPIEAQGLSQTHTVQYITYILLLSFIWKPVHNTLSEQLTIVCS